MGGALLRGVDNTKAAYKRLGDFGHGGIKCPCCGPAPGKPKRTAKRTAKRREKSTAMRHAWAQVS